MADPFDLINSITATVGIAGAATKLSKSLLRTAREVGPASDDIRNFAMDISAFSSVILLAHNALREHYARQSHSSLLKFIKDHRILDRLAEQSVHLIEQVSLIRPRIESLRSRLDLICRFRWLRLKSEVHDIGLQMESVKMNLLLVIHVLALDVYQMKELSRRARREIKNLKRQIRIQIKTASILQQRLEQNPFEGHQFQGSRRHIQNALLALAESMIGDKGVPRLDSFSSSSNGDSNNFGVRRHTRSRQNSISHQYQRRSSITGSSSSFSRRASTATHNTQATRNEKGSQDDQSISSSRGPELDKFFSRPQTSHAEVETKDLYAPG